jgi:hypothetical protein
MLKLFVAVIPLSFFAGLMSEHLGDLVKSLIGFWILLCVLAVIMIPSVAGALAVVGLSRFIRFLVSSINFDLSTR